MRFAGRCCGTESYTNRCDVTKAIYLRRAGRTSAVAHARRGPDVLHKSHTAPKRKTLHVLRCKACSSRPAAKQARGLTPRTGRFLCGLYQYKQRKGREMYEQHVRHTS